MQIVVIGAGGVGGALAGALARAEHEVTVIARGAHGAAIRERGLRVETPDGAFETAPHVTTVADPPARADLVVLAVKSWSLEDVAPVTASLAGAGALVLPLLNGIDAADRLAAAAVPEDAILGGLVYISASIAAPGVVRQTSPFQRIRIGERGKPASTRVDRLVALFSACGWDAAAVDDITLELWRKFMFISSFAAACGLARTALGAVREAPLGPRLLDRAVAEAVAVARGSGIAVAADEEQRLRRQLDGMPAAMKPSLLLDIERGGPTELDALSGAIASLGRRLGVPTPVHDTAVAAIQAALLAAHPG